MRFEGKVALVTGGAQGIGQAAAAALAEEGARVVLFDRNEARVAATARALGAIAVAGDISVRADVRRGVETCITRFGALHILIANAGVTDAQPLLEIEDDRWQRALDVNVTGTFLCVQEAGRAMKGHGGAIVVTASTNAFYVETNLAAYNTSKGGVMAFVRSAAIDLAPYGIRVNAVQPGVVNTPFAAILLDNAEEAANYRKQIPLNRFAEPEETARAILFLASEEASYITGQGLILDGGLTLGIALALPENGAQTGRRQA
jgi:NAD(P)-dependent dehydrogenase (short-subunit alcohol dehydrogenase family)